MLRLPPRANWGLNEPSPGYASLLEIVGLAIFSEVRRGLRFRRATRMTTRRTAAR